MISYELSARARLDLQLLWNYIAEDSVDAAERFTNDVDQAFELLARQPGLGHTRADLPNARYRVWPVHPYLIIYFADAKPLKIHRIVHGARDLKSLFRKK